VSGADLEGGGLNPTHPAATTSQQLAELARLGSATVYEAGGRGGYVDADLVQAVHGSRAAGPARTVVCAQDDNLMVHAVMAEVQPGEVIVLTMPEARPVALVGDLLATQAQVAGAAAILVDASIRDVEELAEMGLPIWARWVRVKGALKETAGELNVPVTVGGAQISPGDVLVLDADGVAVVPQDRVVEVLDASLAREEKERIKREKLQAGAKSYELDGLRAVVEGQR
jgi:4-hydroxy-4-methyl-2-oxoglutarate aldolase